MELFFIIDFIIMAIRVNNIDNDIEEYGITHVMLSDRSIVSVDEIIRRIEQGKVYRVNVPLKPEVEVVNGPDGKYIRSVRNNSVRDNLLRLPRC